MPPKANPALIDEIVDANHILFDQGVVDAFGHVSARHDADPSQFLLARNLAPGLVTAADILAYYVETGEAVQPDPPRLYLERYIHSEIYRLRPDVMAVVHNHSPTVIPFSVQRRVSFKPVCHMCGFLGSGAPVFEIRDHGGSGTDLLVRDRTLGAALAHSLGDANAVLMRGHGATVVGHSVPVAVYRSVYAEVNAKLLQQSLALGEPVIMTPEEAEAALASTEGQVHRPWDLWRAQARAARFRAGKD